MEQTLENIREAVLKTVVRKKIENENKPKGWMGWYHNGVYGCTHPTAELVIAKSGELISAMYTCGGRLWEFYFTKEEMESKIKEASL